MKLKRVGAVLAGAALLGATLAGAAAGTTMDAPDRGFFIDETTGLNNCLIVVGSSAAAADVVSAAFVSAKIGSMAFYEEITENWTMPGVTYTDETQVDNYVSGAMAPTTDFNDFRFYNYVEGTWLGLEDWDDVLPAATEFGAAAPESWVVLPYNWAVSSPWWDYDVYVDPWTSFAPDTNFLKYTACSYETITVDFSIRDVVCFSDLCIGCSRAIDQKGLWELQYLVGTENWVSIGVPKPTLWDGVTSNGTFDAGEYYYWTGDMETLNDIQRAVAVATTNDTWPTQWQAYPINGLFECQTYPNVYPRQYWGLPYGNVIADPVGGISYRTIVDGLDYLEDPVWWMAVVSTDTSFVSEAYNVCDPEYPIEVPLYCDYCEVYFLGKTYNALSFGTDDNGYDYMYYGTPEWFIEEKLAVGESKVYNNGWTLEILDLGIYENKVYSRITNPSGATYDYISVIPWYTSQVPSAGENDYYEPNIENGTLAFVQDTFEVFTLCGDVPNGTIELEYAEVVFAVKFVKTLIGAAGNYVVEYHAYDLKDYGVLKEQIYPGPCETDIEPAIRVGDLEWYFDIIPGDDVQAVDLDNRYSLWLEGNPNYDEFDSLTIYAPMPVDFEGFYNTDGTIKSRFMRYYYTEWDDDLDKYVFTQEIIDQEPQGYTIPINSPMLELWLATPVELAGLCDEEMGIALNDCDGNNYFTLTVSDEIHTDYVIDGEIDIYRKIKGADTVVKKYVSIDPDSLVKLDENITAAMKQQYNLVLIGGPVANSIVQELVDLEYTTFEKWDTSAGEWELVEDVYAVGKDVLIVAGMDRDATAAAALALIAEM